MRNRKRRLIESQMVPGLLALVLVLACYTVTLASNAPVLNALSKAEQEKEAIKTKVLENIETAFKEYRRGFGTNTVGADLWGVRYSAISQIKSLALNLKKHSPAISKIGYATRAYWTHYVNLGEKEFHKKIIIPELEKRAIPALRNLYEIEKNRDVRQNIEETIQIIEEGVGVFFSSELERKIDILINSELNSLFLVHIENANMMLVRIGKSAISALATAFQDDSKFIKLGTARLGDFAQNSTARVVLSSDTLKERVLSVIINIVSMNKDLDEELFLSKKMYSHGSARYFYWEIRSSDKIIEAIEKTKKAVERSDRAGEK